MMDRRKLLRGSAVTLASTSAMLPGCEKPPNAPEPSSDRDAMPQSSSSTIPLRVLVVGQAVDPKVIARGWSAIGQVDLQTTSIDVGATTESIIAAVADTDVVITPSIRTADLVDSQAVDAPRGEWAEQLASQWLPSLAVAMARYGDQFVGFPIGAAVPVICSDQEKEPVPSWPKLDAIMLANPKRAAIPTAIGHAAWTWLSRIPPIPATGLFDRQSFAARIDTPERVESLTQMAELVKSLATPPSSGWTPTSIWNAIIEGRLSVGLSMPSQSSEMNGEVFYLSSPRSGNRVLVPPMAPVALISSRCRQSRLAAMFCRFISGDSSGVEARRSMPAATTVRTNVVGDDPYQRLLIRRYESPLIAALFRITQGFRYYDILDRAVADCVAGQFDAATALASVADQWNSLTGEIGRENQRRAMRRNQGFRS